MLQVIQAGTPEPPSVDEGCRCIFGICIRRDPVNGDHDWYSTHDPNLEEAGLPWFTYIPNAEHLRPAFRQKYLRDSEAYWGSEVKRTTYVGLLRGINVGKAKRVAMADLRVLLAEMGFENVRTLLNSGNVVFTSGKSPAANELAEQIEAAFTKHFGFSSRLTILTADELSEIVEGNPLEKATEEPSRYMIAFLTDVADRTKLEPLTEQAWKPEALALGKRVAYVWCPEGVLASPAFEAVGRALKDGVTTRNWATVTKLHILAGDGA